MKKLIISAVFIMSFLQIGIASAEVEEVEFERPAKTLGIEVGFETSYIKYEEPNVMKEKGMMYGVNTALTYRGSLILTPIEMDRYMFRLEARSSFGQVDYTSNSSGTINNIDDYMLEFRGLGGYDFPILDSTTITPYVGIGYRYLKDDMAGKVSSTGSAGYEREISYTYCPIGIEETIYNFENSLAIKVRLEYDYFLKGTVKSHLSSVPGYYDVKNEQDGGHGYRGSVMFKRIGERVNFIIEPFVRYWSIKASKYAIDPDGDVWVEPKNNSREFGINFAAEY